MQILNRAGCSIDALDTSARRVTPLMEAICENNLDVATLLVSLGASITHQDARDENALHYAARVGGRMIRAISKDADTEKLRQAVCTTNIKLRFPEDVATTPLARELLTSLRERGSLPPVKRGSLKRHHHHHL